MKSIFVNCLLATYGMFDVTNCLTCSLVDITDEMLDVLMELAYQLLCQLALTKLLLNKVLG